MSKEPTGQILRHSAAFRYLVVVPGGTALMYAYRSVRGDSAVRSAAFAACVAGTLLAVNLLFPKGYLFLTPHLAAPPRRVMSWAVLGLILAAFAIVALVVN